MIISREKTRVWSFSLFQVQSLLYVAISPDWRRFSRNMIVHSKFLKKCSQILASLTMMKSFVSSSSPHALLFRWPHSTFLWYFHWFTIPLCPPAALMLLALQHLALICMSKEANISVEVKRHRLMTPKIDAGNRDHSTSIDLRYHLETSTPLEPRWRHFF